MLRTHGPLTLVVALAACSSGPQLLPEPALSTDYAIYWTVLEPLQRRGIFVAAGLAAGYRVAVRGRHSAVAAQFPAAGTTYLNGGELKPLNVTVIPDSLVPRVVFQERHTVISLSQIQFNADSSLAAVFRGYDCGVLCGRTELLLMKRDDAGRWSISRKVETMVR
jgi:hypothetical protein